MQNFILAYKSAISVGFASWAGNADAGFPLTNLNIEAYAKVWRYSPPTSTQGNFARIICALSHSRKMRFMAMCAHNLSRRAQVRVRAGKSTIDLDFVNGAPHYPEVTWSGGVNGTYTDENGIMRTLSVSGSPRIDHDRRYPLNLISFSDDLKMTGGGTWRSIWQADAGARIVDSETVEFGLFGARLIHYYLHITENQPYEITFEACLVDGDGQFDVGLITGLPGTNRITITPEWKLFTINVTTSGSSNRGFSFSYLWFTNMGSATIKLRRVQVCAGPSNGQYRQTKTHPVYRRIGLMHEWAHANWCRHSHAIGNVASWQHNGLAMFPGWSIGLDGALSATLTQAGVSATMYQDVLTTAQNNRWTLSVYFWPDVSGTALVSIGIQWFGSGAQVISMSFNPQAATISSTTASGGATLEAHGIKYVGSGWYRAFVTGIGGPADQSFIRLLFGHNAGAQCAWFGAQLEDQTLTSLIPTTTTSVSRTDQTHELATAFADVAFVNQTSGQSGSVYYEAQGDEVQMPVAQVMDTRLYNSTSPTNDYIQISFWNHPSNTPRGYLSAGNVSGGVLGWGAGLKALANTIGRFAFRYVVGNCRVALDGTLGTDSAAGALPIVNRLRITGPQTGGSTVYIRRITLWSTPFTDAELQAVTTSGPSAIDHDSGWQDALKFMPSTDLPSTWGKDYDVPVIFAQTKAVNRLNVDIFDPEKTGSSTPFQIGRWFIPEVVIQPGKNMDWGAAPSWKFRGSFDETLEGARKVTSVPAIREVAFNLPHLSLAEGDQLHALQGFCGMSKEVMFLPDPDDIAKCQRYGFVGLLNSLDKLKWPQYATSELAFELSKKR